MDIDFKTEVVNQPPPVMPTFPSHQPVGNKKDILKEWEINPSLNLKQELIAFYLLYWEVAINGNDKAETGYQAKLDKLVNQFSLYSDMVVGGEIRHLSHCGGQDWKDSAPLPLSKAIGEGKWGSTRHEAWKNWRMFRFKYGTAALRWLEYGFYLFKSSSFGGPKWANITKVLRMYETHQITPLTFVDTCWGLQHNNGSYFNKVWATSGVTKLLDSVRKGNIDVLKAEATAATKKTLKKWIGEI